MSTTTNINAAPRTLAMLRDYWSSHRAMPSFAVVARAVGISVGSVANAVAELKLENFLTAGPTGRLQPGRRFFERQMLGSVQAGLPISAEDVPAEGMLIDEYLVASPSDTFLLAVKGESMLDAGLFPGDMVVVQKGRTASVGDIVVARLDKEVTVKQLAQGKGGRLFLRARNAAFPDLQLSSDSELLGVVVGQFRRYGSAASLSLKANQRL